MSSGLISLLIPAKSSAHALEHTVAEAHRFFTDEFPGRFEIILIPNPKPPGIPDPDRSTEVADELARRYDHVSVARHIEPVGKGAALKTGFAQARGERIFFTDADLPYDLGFFRQAERLLDEGYDLVTGNRRFMTSFFDLPVDLLPVAYKRHRLGLLFNRATRVFLPLQTTDTQSGIKAMSRRLAEKAFALQECPGFFFDLEIFLTARGQGYRHAEIPIRLHLRSEKSTVRIARDSALALKWLARIAWRSRRGDYGHPPKSILARYLSEARAAGASLGARVFLAVRWWLTPYARMATELPRAGAVLDLGSGHGLFSQLLARGAPGRRVLGVDHDGPRVELARRAGGGLDNLDYEAAGLLDFIDASRATPRAPSDGSQAGISLIDVLHYFEPETQARILKRCYELLEPGGRLIAREVEPEHGAMSGFNRLYEKIATRIGFTRDNAKGLHFRSRRGWERALEDAGFETHSFPCSHFLFADVLFVGQKPRIERRTETRA